MLQDTRLTTERQHDPSVCGIEYETSCDVCRGGFQPPRNGKLNHAKQSVPPVIEDVPLVDPFGDISNDIIAQAPEPDEMPVDEMPPGVPSPLRDGGFSNYYEVEIVGKKEKPEIVKIGFSGQTLLKALSTLTGGWPKAANSLLFAEGERFEPLWMKSAPELIAWIASKLDERTANGLQWAQGADKVSRDVFFASVIQGAAQFDAVESCPHYPIMPRHYYLHPPLGGKTSGAFHELCQRFRPATLVDADLIAAAFMTPGAGIEPGQRPAILIQAQDDDKHGGRGAGKTTLARCVGRLWGGHLELSANDSWETIKTRLLSPNALTKRIALLDNVKTLRFSWADLEAGITTDIISGRMLYVGEGRRPNTLTYFITLNGANLSKDMAQRSVPIVLQRPEKNDPAWEEGTIKLIDERRWDIIADIINILKAPAEPLKQFSRWSAWEKAVLSRVGDPSECQRVIQERQASVDDDQSEADTVREGFREELRRRGHNPDTEVVWMASADAAKIINAIENEERRPFNRAMTHLYLMGIPEIRKSNRHGRGCVWTGEKADPSTAAIRLYGYMG